MPSRRKVKFSIGVLSCGARCCFPMCVLSRFSHVWLCETLWTVARQASLSRRFSRPEYWSGLPCLPPGDCPDPGSELESLKSSCTLQVSSWPLAPPGKPCFLIPKETEYFLHKSMYWCLYTHCLTCHTFLRALHFLAYAYNIFEILKKSEIFIYFYEKNSNVYKFWCPYFFVFKKKNYLLAVKILEY